MKFARIVFAALVVCGLSAYAADASAIAVQITKSNAVLTFPDFEGTKLSLKPYSGATSIQNAKIISSVVAPSDARMHYVVVQLSGPTTSGKGSGQCGAVRK